MMIRKKIKEWRVKLDKKSISTEMLIKQIQFAEMPQLSTNWKRKFTNGTDITSSQRCFQKIAGVIFCPLFFFTFSFAMLPILSVVLCVFITHFLCLFVIFTLYQIKSPFDIVYFVHLYWLFLSFFTFSGAMAGIFTNLYAFVFIFYTSLQLYQSVFFL